MLRERVRIGDWEGDARLDSRATVNVISQGLVERLGLEGKVCKDEKIAVRGWNGEYTDIAEGKLEDLEVEVMKAHGRVKLGETIVVKRKDNDEVLTVGMTGWRRGGIRTKAGEVVAWDGIIPGIPPELTEEEWQEVEHATDNDELNEVLGRVIRRCFPDLEESRMKEGLKMSGADQEGVDLGVDWEELKKEQIRETVNYRGKKALSRVWTVVEEWLKEGIVEEVTDEAAQREMFLWKLYAVSKGKGRGDRGVLDMSGLSGFAKKRKVGIPAMRDLLDSIRAMNPSVLGKIDLHSAFYQLFVLEEERRLLGFRIGRRYFRMTRLPQGFANSSDIFQGVITRELAGLEDFALVYIDDLFFLGTNRRQYVTDLLRLLQRLRDMRATLSLSKCRWAADEISVLGLVVGVKGVRVDEDRIQAILRLKNPANQKELRRWVGMSEFIAEFIEGYSYFVATLSELLKKGARVKLKNKHTAALDDIRHKLAALKEDGGVLVHPVLDGGEVHVFSDGKKDKPEAIGGAVMQMRDGTLCPVGFYGRVLRGYERGRGITDVELMGLEYIVAKARRIYGKYAPLIAHVDHLALVTLLRKPIEKLTEVQRRLAMKIREGGRVEVRYIEGKRNVVADFFSREVVEDIEGSVVVEEMQVRTVLSRDPYDEGYEQWRGKTRTFTKREKRHYRKMDRSLAKVDGKWYYTKSKGKRKVEVPMKSMRKRLIQMVHQDTVHGGTNKMYVTLRTTYYWPTMQEEIHEFVRSCLHCLRAGLLRAARPVQRIFIAQGPFQKVCGDLLIMKRSRKGNVAILVLIDVFTRFCEAIPVSSRKEIILAGALYDGWISRYGPMQLFITDKEGGLADSIRTRKMLDYLGTQHHTATPHLHTGNAIVERLNLEIRKRLGVMALELKDEEVWDEVLPTVMESIRSTPHSALGMSPYEALFGVNIENHTIDMRPQLLTKLRGRIQARLYSKATRLNVGMESEPTVGDVVFVKRETKSKNKSPVRYDGPYAVVWKNRTGQLGVKRIPRGVDFMELKRSGGHDLVRHAKQVVKSSIQYTHIPDSWYSLT